jgi:hypothetical protein
MAVIHVGSIILRVAKLTRFTLNNLLLNCTAFEGVHFSFPLYIAHGKQVEFRT